MNRENAIWTVPNFLSLSRLFLLIPILITLGRGQRAYALLWIVAAIATDFWDGYFARRLNQRSNLGRVLDPLIDKVDALAVSILLVLSPLYPLPVWFFIFLLVREVTLLVCSFSVIVRKRGVMESNRAGKNSAFATAVTLFFYAMQLPAVGAIMVWVAFILTLYSSWIYFRLFLQRVKESRANIKNDETMNG
ncbi:CDP-alcohol phosphatidyltransferase family protein [bacterium]|nr:CDP-alcohol phosphatidyltransferase family protein [bacterium]